MPAGRLLIVDDEGAVLDVLSEYFAGHGYAVDTASNGEAALAAVHRRRPDLVLLDVRMPGIDGVEVLRRIRAIEDELPVIMVTANEDVALAREMLKIGAFDYVAKPFDFSYLDRAVTAGMLHSASTLSRGEDDNEEGNDLWARLAHTVFRAVREMGDRGRASTGARLEAAALAAVRHARAGRVETAAEEISDVRLLVSIAEELGDLSGSGLSAVNAAVSAVRRAVSPAI